MNKNNQMTVFLFTFILGLLLPLILLTKKPSAYNLRLNEIKKATVQLVYSDRVGSGGLIQTDLGEGKNEFIILTNSHVCIDGFSDYIQSEQYSENFSTKTTTVWVVGENARVKINIENKNLIFNTYKDYCIIKVDPKIFPKNYFAFIPIISPEEVSKENLVKKIPDNKLKLFTRNYSPNKVLIKEGFFSNKINYSFNIGVKNPITKERFLVERGPASQSSIDMIPGDSGSLIYDKDLNLVGLAFGYHLDTDEKASKPLNEDEDIVFSFLKERKLKPTDLPKLKNDMTELSCLFIFIDQIGGD